MYRIRKVENSDAESLRYLYASVIKEQLPYILQNEIPSLDDEKIFIESVISSGGAILVAVNDNNVIGVVTVSRLSHVQLRHRASFGVSVAKAHRNRGIGSRLVEAAIEWCRSNQIVQLSLEALKENPAVSLYSRLGFVTLGSNPVGVKVQGCYKELVSMATEISSQRAVSKGDQR